MIGISSPHGIQWKGSPNRGLVGITKSLYDHRFWRTLVIPSFRTFQGLARDSAIAADKCGVAGVADLPVALWAHYDWPIVLECHNYEHGRVLMWPCSRNIWICRTHLLRSQPHKAFKMPQNKLPIRLITCRPGGIDPPLGKSAPRWSWSIFWSCHPGVYA